MLKKLASLTNLLQSCAVALFALVDKKLELTSISGLPHLHKNILPVDNEKQGSKVWMTKLFQEHPIGFYWTQADVKDSLNFVADHVAAAHIIQG